MNGNGKGSFVTNKWLVGVLVSLVISMGGYIYTGIDRSRDLAIARAMATEARVMKLEVETSALTAENRAQFAEILRRLDRIEAANWRRSRDTQ